MGYFVAALGEMKRKQPILSEPAEAWRRRVSLAAVAKWA